MTASSATPKPPGGEPQPILDIDEPGIWVITTRSGAVLLVAIVLEPTTGAPIVTLTRYAAAGHGDHLNGMPMTVTADGPPTVGERWAVRILQARLRDEDGAPLVWQMDQPDYLSTPVARIVRLTFTALPAIS